MTITTPGFYDLSESEYHADPAPIPSLSSGCAKTLISKSPMHAYAEHPRLGEKAFASTDEMDFGSLAHRLLLGKGADIAIFPADSWRGKDAAAFWDESVANSHIPCLKKTIDRAETMVMRINYQLTELGIGHIFHPDNNQAKSEVAGLWKEDESWCRFLTDRLIIDEDHLRANLYDLKTMGQSSHPKACAARIASMGYDIQQAHYLRGLEALRPDLAGRTTFTFIFVETNPPFAVTPVEISGEWARVGEAKWQRAIELWKQCNETGIWPGYTSEVMRLEAPMWALGEELEATY